MTDSTTQAAAPSNTAHHSAIIGIIITALGFISSPFVLHFLPEKWAALAQAIGAALAAFGITKQVQQNTQATTASTAAVTQAITNASPSLAANASVAAAQARARSNPLQGG